MMQSINRLALSNLSSVTLAALCCYIRGCRTSELLNCMLSPFHGLATQKPNHNYSHRYTVHIASAKVAKSLFLFMPFTGEL